jgi:hypothetical protein
MKMVKSLLLGTAAGLVAMSGAQAADLPVKAKPVDYVRICTAYGAGFYYIPGTDICLRVGGYAFIEAGYNARAGVPLIYNYNIGTNLILDRDDNRTNWRGRGTVYLDARSQTPQGTLRTYIAGGWDYNNNLNGAAPPGNITPYFERAFTQWAGFTFGYLESWFDFWPTGVYMSGFALATHAWDWTLSFAYTASFGNGVSLTFAIEDGQATRTLLYQNNAACTFTQAGGVISPGAACNAYGGQLIPDLILNLRVDQAWGSAQLAAALHQLRVNQGSSLGLTTTTPATDAFGWAVLAGINVNLPSIAPGDMISLQGVYTEGNVERTGLSTSPLASATALGLRNALGLGPVTAVYDAFVGGVAPTIFARSKAWSATAGFRHWWTSTVRTNFILGYLRYEPAFNGTAFPAFALPPIMTLWQGAIGTTWTAAPGLDLSLDFLYTNLSAGTCAGAAVVAPASICGRSTDIFGVWTRWRRNF